MRCVGRKALKLARDVPDHVCVDGPQRCPRSRRECGPKLPHIGSKVDLGAVVEDRVAEQDSVGTFASMKSASFQHSVVLSHGIAHLTLGTSIQLALAQSS
jgi:hypothetical protein